MIVIQNVGEFNNLLTSIDRLNRKSTRKKLALNDTVDQIHLTDIFRTFHSKTTKYTLFSRAHGTFSRIDHILGHKTNLNKFKNIKVIPCIFSDHNAMKLEIHHMKKSGKTTNTWRLNNMLLNNKWVNQEIREKKKIHGDLSGLLCRACDSESQGCGFEPHVGHRDHLKIKY